MYQQTPDSMHSMGSLSAMLLSKGVAKIVSNLLFLIVAGWGRNHCSSHLVSS